MENSQTSLEQREHQQRRAWITPSLTGHSTMTELTQTPLSQPLSLLFLQASQCFDQDGNPVTCPTG